MDTKYLFGILLLAILAGCVQQPEKLGCCSPESAVRGFCEFQGEFSEPFAAIISDPNAQDNIVQGGCDDESQTCAVTFIIESNGADVRKSYDIPICNSQETACVSEDCLAQVCSPFAYAPSVSPSFRDLDSFKSSKKITGAPFATNLRSENLLNTSCLVLPMNEQLTTFFKNSKGSFINIFRFGVGTSFESYEYYHNLFPLSDYFCNINSDVTGAKDRFMNYLLSQDDYEDKEDAFSANQDYELPSERIVNSPAFCPQTYGSPFISATLGGPITPNYKMNEIVTTSHDVEQQQLNNEIVYREVGPAKETSYEQLDRDFYASALRLQYKNELEGGLRQNPPSPAQFECEGALQCQSGYCSFDTYYRGLCQKRDGTWTECGCSEAQLNCVGKSPPRPTPDNIDLDRFAENFNQNPDANNYVPQQLDAWFLQGSMNPTCDVYDVSGWETDDNKIIDDLCVLHGNNKYECGGFANEDKFLLSCRLVDANSGRYACDPTSEEDVGTFRDCRYDAGQKAVSCNVQTILDAAPCVDQNGAFACGPNPENPTFICDGGTCVRDEARYPGCEVNEQGMHCEVDGPVEYPGCVAKEGEENTILCGAKTKSSIQTSLKSPVDDALFPRDIKFFGTQIADPYSYDVIVDENGEPEVALTQSYIGFSLLPSNKPLTRTNLRPAVGAVYERWEDEIRQVKQLGLFENTMLASQCNLQYGRDYDVVRGMNHAGLNVEGGNPEDVGIGPEQSYEEDESVCGRGRDLFDGWGQNGHRALYDSCFFRAPYVVREGAHVNYGSQNIGTPECNTFEDDYAEFYFTPEFVLLKAHQERAGQNEPWYLGDCKLNDNFVPVTKTFGWCEGCSLLTSAYQTIESSEELYKVDSTKRVFSDEFSIPKISAPTEVFVPRSGYNYFDIPESTLLRAEFTHPEPVDPDFDYYGTKNVLYFNTLPDSTYLQQKQSEYLRAGVLPILDVTDDSNWQANRELFDAVMPEGPSVVILDSVTLATSAEPQTVQRIKERVNLLIEGENPISTKAQFAIRLDAGPLGFQPALVRTLSGIAMLDALREADPACAPNAEPDESCIFSQRYVTAFVYSVSADEFVLGQNLCDGNGAGEQAVTQMSQISGHGIRSYGLLSYIEDLSVNPQNACWQPRNQNGVQTDAMRSFYSTIFARQITLTKSGVMGVNVKNADALIHVPSPAEIAANPFGEHAVSNTDYFCSLSQASGSLAADLPITVLHKSYARPLEEVICQECSPYDPSCGARGDPALVCADGSVCIAPGGVFDPDVNYKCPDFTIADTCNLCADFQNPLSCTRQYADGSSQRINYRAQNSVGSVVSGQGDIIPDIIASIPSGQRCCLLDAQGEKYTYFKQENSGSVRAPLVFNRNADLTLDCGVPDLGSTNDEFVCSNQNSPIKNYNLRCVLE